MREFFHLLLNNFVDAFVGIDSSFVKFLNWVAGGLAFILVLLILDLIFKFPWLKQPRKSFIILCLIVAIILLLLIIFSVLYFIFPEYI